MREFKIGRLASNDIVINEPTVSKYHAILRIEQTGVTLTDLNSTNGTFVNGNRVEDSIQLNELDIVKLGLVLFDWNDYVGSNLEQKKASYQSYSEPDDLPQQEIEEEKNESIVVQQSVYNSPSTNITQKSTNYTPLIIFIVILGFLGLAGLIIEISDSSSSSNYPDYHRNNRTNENNSSSNETPKEENSSGQTQSNERQVNTVPKLTKSELLEEGTFYNDNYQSTVNFYKNKFIFDMIPCCWDGDYRYTETFFNENYNLVVVYNHSYKETLKIKILSPTSFEIIESTYNHGADFPYSEYGIYSKK
jgi:pSer/pThr/pTyr-binding forkhead associated (FHA) protein